MSREMATGMVRFTGKANEKPCNCFIFNTVVYYMVFSGVVDPDSEFESRIRIQGKRKKENGVKNGLFSAFIFILLNLGCGSGLIQNGSGSGSSSGSKLKQNFRRHFFSHFF
jgi:hypothetical protein